MPIRMVEDDNKSQPDNFPGGGGGGRRPGGGGGNIGGGLIGVLLMLFGKNPKLLILLVIGGVLLYFFGGKGCMQQVAQMALSTGAEFDPALYDQTEIFEPLADNAKNPLPESFSLEKYCPTAGDQGRQGSCVGWGSAYCARTVLEAQRTGADPDQIRFSPSFLYNQIALQGCQGSYIQNAMEEMKGGGALPLSQFPYDESNCSRNPSQSQLQQAAAYRTYGFNRLTNGDSPEPDLLAIKQNIAQGAPVVIGMMVGGSFMQDMMGKEYWIPTTSDYNMMSFGGHCMTIVGYDDYKFGTEAGNGAFLIHNSWGPQWGKDGRTWVRYKDFAYFGKEAYGVHPMGNADKPLSTNLSVQFGLVENQSQQNIALAHDGGILFSTPTPIARGTKFKVEITNTLECYTYIFAQDTDQTSYVLFPYTPKHSPYCGITGTRLFPKDYSLLADETGTRDFMAIVVTKQPVDFKAMNESINRQSGTFEQKVRSALKGQLITNVNYTASAGYIGFDVNNVADGAVAMVIRVDKR
jgi:C1A family cysteine protease